MRQFQITVLQVVADQLLVAAEGDEGTLPGLGNKLLELCVGDAGFVLGRAEFGAGEHAAEVLVAGAGGDQEREGAAVLEGELGAGDVAGGCTHASRCGGGSVGARGAVDTVAVGDGDRGELEFRGALDEFVRLAGAAVETEGAAGVKFGEHARRRGGFGGMLRGIFNREGREWARSLGSG